MKFNIFLLNTLLLVSLTTFSQKEYKLLMDDISVNFYDVCKSANDYFETHEKGKGSGWKGYQRWKNANEYKYYPSGDRSNIDPFFVKNAYISFTEKNSSNQTKSSFNAGWEELGPFSIDSISGHYSAGLGRIEDHYVDPLNTDVMYLGSRSGGFWRTADAGVNWQVTTDFLFASGVNTIAVSPTNSDSVLINVRNSSNGNSHGLYRSIDGGENWVQSNFNPTNIGFGGLGSNFKIYEARYHPRVADLVFIGTSKGIYRSDDNLVTWTLLLNGGDIEEIQFHPTDNTIIYLYDSYYWGTNKNVVMRSIDQGLSYTQSNNVAGNNDNRSVHLSVSTDCDSCLYWGSDNGVWISTDNGINFTFRSNSAEGCGGFAVNDLDTTKMIYGYVDVDRSSDGGLTWTDATRWSLGNTNGAGSGHQNSFQTSTDYVHADLHPAKCVNGVFYIGTDGLFCKSTDNGLSWTNLSQGIGVRENYKLGASQSNHYRSISGSQDNGTSIKHQNTWIEFNGGDGMEGLIHPLNDDWILGSYQFGSRYLSKNGGQSSSGVSPSGQSGSGNGGWEAPITYDPNNQMRLYNFSHYIYKSEDFGTSWDSIGAPVTFAGTIGHSAIAENNTDIIIISAGDNIEKSVDAGVTFIDIKNNLPNSNIQDIAFDPNDDNTILVVYASYQNNNQKVYKTINGGNSWTNITNNIGDMPIHSVVIDHSSASNIYLGAEIGVYTMPMNSANWVLYNSSLPNTTIQELEIINGSNTLKAATWGRGMWEYSLVGRNDYPSILKTSITDQPTEELPLENVDQFVTSIVSMENAPTLMYVKWSINSPLFTNTIQMTNTMDSTWLTDTAIPNQTFGTKVYFKVFAVANGDTTETYKFMYTVKENKHCTSSGTMSYQGNVTLVDFANINNATGKTQPYTDYTDSDSTVVFIGDSYDLTVNLNTDGGNYTYYSTVWIDWNQDIVFDPSEKYEVGSAQNVSDMPTNLSPFSIQVPVNAVLGNTVMRVVCNYNSYQSNPCANGYDGEVEDYSITVKQFIVPTLNYSFVDSILCEGQDLVYTYTGDLVDSLIWTFTNGTDTYTSTSLTGVVLVPISGNYDVTIEGFTNDGLSYVESFSGLFSVNSVNNIIVNETTCDVNNVGIVVQNLMNQSGCDSTITTITTLFPSSAITINETTCNINGVGTVIQNLLNQAGCDSIITTITSLELINATISGNLNVLTASPSGLVYQWIDCTNNDVIVIGETNEIFTTDENGDYAVVVYDGNCTDTTDCYTVSGLGVLNHKLDFNLFPNPTSSNITLEFSNKVNELSIHLTNDLGQLVKEIEINNKKSMVIDMSNLSDGIYFLHISDNDETTVTKVIKQ